MKTTPRRILASLTLMMSLAFGLTSSTYAQVDGSIEKTGIQSIDPEPVDADWWRNRHKEKLAQIENDSNIDLVVLGDSITHGWEGSGKSVFEEYFGQYKSLNIGYGGDRTEHVLWRLQNGEVDGITPKVLVMMIGTNNTGQRKEKPELTALGISLILSELQTRLPETKILMLAVFPRDAEKTGELRQINDKVNQIISRMGDGDQVEYMDINSVFLTDEGVLTKKVMPDLLHPQEDGYRMWAEAISGKVKQLMNEASDVEDDSTESADGFEPIFDGKSLTGWRGAEGFWKVEDGAMTGETSEEKPLESNTFIIWDKPVKNFELKLKFRMTEGNSGIQYRS